MKTNPAQHLTTTISVRITAEERWALETRASGEERTVSNFVRRRLRDALLPPEEDTGGAGRRP
jgi:uncharacterized protein (DUF1778 family)